jgi:hypothetical protein
MLTRFGEYISVSVSITAARRPFDGNFTRLRSANLIRNSRYRRRTRDNRDLLITVLIQWYKTSTRYVNVYAISTTFARFVDPLAPFNVKVSIPRLRPVPLVVASRI